MSAIMKHGLLYLYLIFSGSFPAFGQQLTPVLFKPVAASESQINFANVLHESSLLNIITYEYF